MSINKKPCRLRVKFISDWSGYKAGETAYLSPGLIQQLGPEKVEIIKCR